jgi:hypothetical protein
MGMCGGLSQEKILLLFFAPKNAKHFDVDRENTQPHGIELCHEPLGLKDAAFL